MKAVLLRLRREMDLRPYMGCALSGGWRRLNDLARKAFWSEATLTTKCTRFPDWATRTLPLPFSASLREGILLSSCTVPCGAAGEPQNHL